MTREQGKVKIAELVERFSQNVDVYKSGAYNETQVRVEFIDPFFHALGWDVHNINSYAEQYKDVVHEDAIKVGVSLKAPDYSFRIGGQRKFFLEAKKPSVSIKSDQNPAYQLRRYAWSAKLQLSVLTDFEELAIYDCRIQPSEKDKVSTGRVAYYTYDQYLEKFDELYGVLSKDAVLKGSFDRFAETTKLKKGTAEVDTAFLRLIESWRDELARNIALRNKGLDIDELNFSVQHTIDRIIFLRICEDRGIENYGQLQALLNGVNTYPRLLELFYKADDKYNSGLFDFKADRLSHSLDIDDRPLKQIIEELYHPKSPYEFSVIGADILGNVYEQFLGKVIRLTAGHQAKVEEKPEVKKAGGVFYTPEYIVEYIVKNTVGRALEGKTPAQASKIRILDPACGSGSFLINAYQYLIDWHTNWYTANGPDRHAKGKSPAVFFGKGGWRLTTFEKKRILLNNIYGVDIDRQAVEVTKLSLLLKVLEGESQETVGKLLSLFRERVLPNLEENIKCGNSLIGPDFYNQMELLSGDDTRRINVFDWDDDKRGFGRIMKEGGFDCVIGNPPYGAWFHDSERNYFLKKYDTFSEIKDIYTLFIETGFVFVKSAGYLSYIVPSAFTGGPNYRKLRQILLANKFINIVMLPFDVFKNAYIDTLIFVSSKEAPKKDNIVNTFVYPKKEKLTKIDLENNYLKVNQQTWNDTDDQKIILNPFALDLMTKIKKSSKLTFGDILKIKRGVLFDKNLLSQKKITENDFKYFEGDVYRYVTNEVANNWIEFGPKLKECPKEFDWFEGKRILLRRLVNRQKRLMSSIVSNTFITNKNLYTIKTIDKKFPLEIILAILNSQLISFLYLNQISQATKDDFPQVTITDVQKLLFPSIKLDDKALRDKIISLVERMLDLNTSLQKAKTPHDRELLERQISATDRQIDGLVYELYGLTPAEIEIIEKGLA